MCKADESYAKNPKYARSRTCACIGVAHEILAALLLGTMQFFVWWATRDLCVTNGRVKRYADITDDQIETSEKHYCEGPYKNHEHAKKICNVIPNYKDLAKDSRAFCNAETSVIAIGAVSIVVSLVLFFVAITNACKCCSCESCCGGKKKKNFINVIISGVGSIIALVGWIIFLAHNGAWTRYNKNRKEVEEGMHGSTSDPLKGWFPGEVFQPALTICLIWGFFLIVQRVVQGVFSFLASREEWQDGEITDIEMAKAKD